MDELALLREFRIEDAAADGARDHARRVLAAARARDRVRRRYVLALAFLVAAVVAGAAYAIVRELVVGDPAPPEVERQLARFGQEADLIPYKRPGAPDTENLHVLAVLESTAGRAYLFGAPDGHCAHAWIEGNRFRGRLQMMGACGDGVQTFWAFGRQRFRDREVRLLFGRGSDDVARVTVRFGARELTVPLTEERWFFAEFAQDPGALVTYDSRGEIIREYPIELGGRRRGRPAQRPHQVGRAREVHRIHARGGAEVVTLEVARASDGGNCMIVRSNVKPTNRGCSIPTPKPREIGVVPMQFGGASPTGIQLLVGPVGSEIVRLRLTFQDGRQHPVPLNDGWALYEVVRADYAEGRRPAELIAFDNSGHVVARQRLPWAR